ncbi:hypothetical protein SEA_NICHOLASP3_79 [Mycobacterium phage Nicholasp3]|nr:hypothetical protein SEA_NICHOLASP3_79 [Mycobacterium phage Nicholasp3]
MSPQAWPKTRIEAARSVLRTHLTNFPLPLTGDSWSTC